MKIDLVGLEKVVPKKPKFPNGIFIVGNPVNSSRHGRVYPYEQFEQEYTNITFGKKENKK